MQVIPYLSFDGRCEEAFKFYQQILGGKILMTMKYGDSPMAAQTPAEFQQKVMHTRMQVADFVIMGSDSPAGLYVKPQGLQVSLNLTEPTVAERVFAALSEKANTIVMPLGETFWALRFGMLVDQFGIPWMVNCERPEK